MRCQTCNTILVKDTLKCNACGMWNHMINTQEIEKLSRIRDVKPADTDRIITGKPWDANFGGGIARISTTLLGGEPGAGKSTIALQLASAVADMGIRTIYFGTEENPGSIRSRADRIGISEACEDSLYIYDGRDGDVQIEDILSRFAENAFGVVDSLPNLACNDLQRAVEICKVFKGYASAFRMPFVIIDHVTKEHSFAGLMTLQHEVDTLITFKVNEKKRKERELETIKNRFGPVGDQAKTLWEMTERGLMPVKQHGIMGGTQQVAIASDELRCNTIEHTNNSQLRCIHLLSHPGLCHFREGE